MPDSLPDAARTARALARWVVAACILAGSTLPGAAQRVDRWTTHETEAQATLPLPAGSQAITALTLTCTAQRWTLEAALSETLAADTATLTIDGRPYALTGTVSGSTASLRVPRAALEPLKTALRAELAFPGGSIEPLSLSLRGSKLAITALQERCTPRDMSAYQAVTLTPYSSYINLARDLRAADIEAFATATASQPQVTAAMAEIGAGKRILFTRLCGSSWYYGRSGCNVTGFVPEPGEAEEGDGDDALSWRAVYDTESVLLHTDPKSLSHGWPDIVTLPVRAGSRGLIWRWDGKAYALKGELPEEDEQVETLRLRPTRD